MAATGEYIGNSVDLAYNSASTTWISMAIFTNGDALSLSTGEAETTSHGVTGRTYVPGLTDGEYSFTLNFNDDTTLTTAGKPQELILGLQTARSVKPWRVRPKGTLSGAIEWLFSAFVSGYDVNFANDDDPISADVTLKISGAVTTAVQT